MRVRCLFVDLFLEEVFIMRNARLQALVLAGLLAAMAFVLKLYLSFTTFDLRITFYEIPVLLGSILLGPAIGGMIGLASDFAYISLAGFPFSFLLALSSVIWGVLPGLLIKKVTLKRVILAVIMVSLIAFSLNSWQLYIWAGSGMWVLFPLRLLVVMLKWPIQVYVVMVIYERVQSVRLNPL